MNRDVAVIIPVYNTEATLARCIDSVLAQTVPAAQVIIVDDGSPDRAGAIADGYAARYAFITVIHKENQGLAEARRTGLLHASCPLVMHLDSDDTLPPDAIEFLLGKLTEHDLDIAYGCYLRIPSHGQPHPLHHMREGVMTGEEFLELNLTLGALNSSCCNISRRDLWTPDVFPPAGAVIPSEDTYININMAFNMRRAGQWNHPTYCYHANAESLTLGGRQAQLEPWQRYFTLLEDTLRRHGMLDRYRRHLHELKVDRLAFYIRPVNPSHPWVSEVLSDNSHQGLSRKTRLLMRLLRHPALARLCISANRRLKSLLR